MLYEEITKLGRGLSHAFLADLREEDGKLFGLLQAVQCDDALCLEIREEYINVYYRGGCLFKVNPGYAFAFDENYFCDGIWPFDKPKTTEEWLRVIPKLKAAMDYFLYRNPKTEREVQQMILRDNTNSRVANETDYFITDIEYQGQGFRFDMVAAKWLAAGHRSKGNKASLAIIEVKYADGSLAGDAGLKKHMQDVIRLLKNENGELSKLIDETNTLANQKRMLGLFPQLDARNPHKIAIPQNCKKELIFVLVNTNPRAGKMRGGQWEEVLADIQNDKLIHRLNELNCKLLLARASYMGYGLYAKCMKEIKPEPLFTELAN